MEFLSAPSLTVLSLFFIEYFINRNERLHNGGLHEVYLV
jgi:hypothetical protein